MLDHINGELKKMDSAPFSVVAAAPQLAARIRKQRARLPLLAAYDLCLKCSHLFNILDARGAISVTERVGVIARVRALAVGIAKAWVDQQKQGGISDEQEQEEEKPAAKKIKTERVTAIS